MRGWLAFLVRNRLLDVALAVAVGSAAATAAQEISQLAVSVLAQHVGNDPSGDDGLLNLFYGPYDLNFTVGDTVVVYGQVLVSALTIGLIGLAAVPVLRRRNRELGECPFCASRIPYESTHCAYCGSAVAPGEP